MWGSKGRVMKIEDEPRATDFFFNQWQLETAVEFRLDDDDLG